MRSLHAAFSHSARDMLCSAILGAALVLGMTNVMACTPQRNPDWLSSAPALTMPVSPADCSSVDQTPPQFSWPDQGDTRYLVELRDHQGKVVSHQTDRNWLLMDAALPAGIYQWRVVMPDRRDKAAGEWRQFTVPDGATPFPVPLMNDLAKKVTSKSRPRAYPTGEEKERYLQALASDRKASWDAFLVNARQQLGAPHVDAPDSLAIRFVNQKDYSTKLGDNKKNAGYEINRMLDSALVWKVTGERSFLIDARETLLLMARWDPDGPTGINHHQLAGRTLWSMALGLDWLYSELSPTERKEIVGVLASRMEALINEFDIWPRRKLDKAPLNSHGWVALGEAAAAASLLLGEHPRARVWFDATVRPFAFLYSPWGGMDGGMGNGTAYGTWDSLSLTIPMDVLRLSTGVDLFRKGWSQNLGRFLTYFAPPGTRRGIFGDGAEKSYLLGDIGNLANAHASRSTDPLLRWYAKQVPARRANDFIQVFPAASLTKSLVDIGEIPTAAHFPTIGWTAMHSSLKNREKISIYFKSSSFGSFNHSHADQNSFALSAFGQPLLIDSGYYDFYGSKHHDGWYRQTQAHNAITYDGGKGQILQRTSSKESASGKIVAFATSESIDYVIGDSTQAYGGALQKAFRTVVFLKPSTVVVYDVLSSTTPRRWEWNLHALAKFKQINQHEVFLQSGDEKLCITMSASSPVGFEQTDQFAVAPDFKKAADVIDEKQWHGQFFSSQPSKEVAFIAVLNVGCSVSKPAIADLGNKRYRVTLGAIEFEMSPLGLTRH